LGPAFVAGATGFTGREVVRTLRAPGVHTVAHVRPDSPSLREWQERFRALGAEVDATPWEGAEMTATLRRLRPSVVFALLGTTRRRARAAARRGRAEDYEAVDYGLTHLLLEAASACGTRPRFVYLSSAGTRDDTRNRYLLARARLERELRAAPLPFVIARPSIITGAGRDDLRPLELLAAATADAVLGIAGRLGARGLAARYRSTTSTALAAALVRLALDPAAERRVAESEELRG
jgi:nucleoside-diphosphate-sugar epimerase